MLDVKFGIGIIKNVLNVLEDGYSLQEFVYQLIIFAKHGTVKVFVHHAIEVMKYKMENVSTPNYKNHKI